MKHIMLVASIVAALLMPAPARAETDFKAMMRPQALPPLSSLVAIPPEMQQRWILEGCERGEVAFRFSRRFVMISIPQGSKIFRLGGFGALGNGRYSMSMPGETSGLMLGSDGRLIQYFGELNSSFSVAQLESLQIMVPHIIYDQCSDAAKIAVKEDAVLRALLPALDQMQEACPAPGDIHKVACQQSIFAVFDQNQDGSLDVPELNHGWEVLISYSPFGTCGAAATAADSLRRDGADYMRWLLDHADTDHNQKISFTEFMQQWKNMRADPLMSGFANLLIAADKPIGILPADITVSCVNCCVSAR